MPLGRTRKTRMIGASPKNSEFLTRKELIDRRITDAGWRIVRGKDFDADKPLTAYNRCAIEEYPTDNGPADYALIVNGQSSAWCSLYTSRLRARAGDDGTDERGKAELIRELQEKWNQRENDKSNGINGNRPLFVRVHPASHAGGHRFDLIYAQWRERV